MHDGVGCHLNDFFMRLRRALSSVSWRWAGVRSEVLMDPSSISPTTSSSEFSSTESSLSSAGGLGRKYVADGGFWIFSSETAIELSRTLNA